MQQTQDFQIWKHNLVKSTFYITYIMLITTGTITFIEALRTKNADVRHVMNLETCISIIAAYFYSQFIEKIKKAEEINKDKELKSLPYGEINLTRYTDWLISTPFMLLVLCIVLGMEQKRTLYVSTFFVVLVLDICMLASGYFGETGKLNKMTALIIGFCFFFALFGYIWAIFMTKKHTFIALFSYIIFFIFWSIYGVIYMTDEETKNIVYNFLDLIAKCFVGIYFWMYFTGVVRF